MAKMVEIDWNPDAKTLRQFGWVALVGFGVVALLAWKEWLIFAFGLGDARTTVTGALLGMGVLIALIAVFGMIRPAIRAAVPPAPPEPAPESVSEVVDDTELLPGPDGLPRLEAPLHNEKLDRARALARDNPVAVANIVRDWMAGETAS